MVARDSGRSDAPRAYFWALVVLSVLIPAGWLAWGFYYNAHSESSVGGPLAVVGAIFASLLSDLALWTIAWALARALHRGASRRRGRHRH
jgi:hypothetical protein